MYKGENSLLRKQLKRADGTDLNISSILDASVKIEQYGVELKKYTLGVDGELREGSLPNELELEITKVVSETLPVGRLKLIYTIEVANSDFETESRQIDIFTETLLISR